MNRRKFFGTMAAAVGAAFVQTIAVAPFVPAATKVIKLKNVSLQFPKLYPHQYKAMGWRYGTRELICDT